MKRLKALSWPLVMLLAGIAATAYVGTDIAAQSARFAEGRDWPSVEGRVSTSALEEGSSYQKYGSDAIYRLRVRYSYTAEGRLFVNDRVSLASEDSFRDRDEANSELAEYPAGAAVPVYYQPGNPGNSALIVEGVRWDRYVGLAFGIVVALLGLLWLIAELLGPRKAGGRPGTL